MRRYLPATLCLLLAVGSALSGYAVISQTQTRSRGLDLGAPLNRPVNLYGINVDLLRSPDRDSQLTALKETGFGWVRQTFDWRNMDWAAAEALAESTQANGLGLVAVLTGSEPPDPVEFAAFASQFAKRFANSINYYQIWDEPNLESDWSGPPSAAEYARVLQAAYTAIHGADPTATVILAGLAPTIETGPKNIGDVLYLRQLYELGAQPYFDAVAGKPYGFNTSPYDRAVDANVLNFSRLILLREEMIAHGDGGKFVWGSNFGWNTRPSIWGQVKTEQQLEYTRDAFDRAANEWQWAGPLFLQTPDPNLAVDDPRRGFAISDLRLVSGVFSSPLKPGKYPAQSLTAYAIIDGAWKFSDLGADIPQNGPATITFNFIGADLALTVRRADYRAYLFVTVDDQPANALPKDTHGEAYVILTSPDLQPRVDTVTLASGLAPGPHIAVIRAERGWDQWAIVGVTVGPNVARPDTRLPLTLIAIVGIASLVGLVISFRALGRHGDLPLQNAFARIGDLGQTLLAALVSVLLWASAWLTWGSDIANTFRKYGDTAPLIATVLTAGIFYYSPFLLLTLVSLAILFVLFYLRPDLALPLIAFFAPFYLLPRPLWDRAFSMVEICTVLALFATTLRAIPSIRNSQFTIRSLLSTFRTPHSALDLSVLAFTVISAAAMLVADVRGVATREFRVIVLEPALFYLLLRIRLSTPSPDAAWGGGQGVGWRIVDFFLIGAVIVALYGLSNLVTGQNLITAEGGVARIRSVFGSPNNLGLFLGRAIPIAAAIALLGRRRSRRILYSLALLPILAAAVLSFSRGALLFGIPAALGVVLLFWGGRRAALALAGLAGAGLVALIPLSRNPRFANLFSTSSGTGFFRVNVWRSAWAMFTDHPVLGVGLDNFLYAYRGKYILPEAWQEPNLPHAHNIFLDALTRTGLLGFAALIVMLVSFFALARNTLRRITDPDLRALAIGLIASMVNFLAHGLVDTGYWFVDLAFVFMMTLGLLAGISRFNAGHVE